MKKEYFKEIKGLRAKHGDSQENCAKVIGTSVVTYRNKEKGLIEFKFSEICKLMDHWNEPLTELL